MELWTELYAGFGLVPAPAGNTGVQMGGWFNKEINSVEDLKGLKMRIPGLGGEVLAARRRHAGQPARRRALHRPAVRRHRRHRVGRPLQRPGLRPLQGAKYYYYPGWHEPGTTLEA
jgi:TRAP-type mannitol/chloroaromatic compound transport system substrate-binding protein